MPVPAVSTVGGAGPTAADTVAPHPGTGICPAAADEQRTKIAIAEKQFSFSFRQLQFSFAFRDFFFFFCRERPPTFFSPRIRRGFLGIPKETGLGKGVVFRKATAPYTIVRGIPEFYPGKTFSPGGEASSPGALAASGEAARGAADGATAAGRWL